MTNLAGAGSSADTCDEADHFLHSCITFSLSIAALVVELYGKDDVPHRQEDVEEGGRGDVADTDGKTLDDEEWFNPQEGWAEWFVCRARSTPAWSTTRDIIRI